MTVVRRELPRSRARVRDRSRLSHRTVEDSPFDVGRSDHWVNAAQTKPVSSRATAVTTCCFALPRAAKRDSADGGVVAPSRPARSPPAGRRPARGASAPDEGTMPIVPRGFDQHAPEMGVAGLGDRAARAFRRRWSAPRARGRRRPSCSGRWETGAGRRVRRRW